MDFSLLQWNIWYLEDTNNIATFLKDHPTDIVCLQELTIGRDSQAIKHSPNFIAKELGFHHYLKEIQIEGTDGQKFILANGIFSKYPLSDTKFVWINQPRGSGGYDDEYRAYIQAKIDFGGKSITVGTTHMSYTDKFQPTERKKFETDKLVEELSKQKNRFIFSGDLNALPGSYTVNEISKILKNSGPDFGQNTWTTKPFSYRGFEAKKLNWRLDYVFNSPDLKVESAQILQTEFSDHLPVLVKFSV